MNTTRYLLVGGGNTAHAAAAGIREHDADGPITIVGAETHPPYKRPPLSKGLWGGGDEAKIWLKTAELGGVDLQLGRRIASIDPAAHVAVDDRGEEIRYEKLLLATGGRPREIPGAEGVVYFRTLDDYRLLRERAGEGKYVVVIGGGFIGSELAAALVGAGAQVTMVFPEPAIGWRLFPAELAHFVTGYYRDRGVEVLTDETVAGVAGGKVKLGSGRVLDADLVVAGLGIIPRTELAEAAGLPVDNGIVVDEHGRVEGVDDVFAAGDVANFPAPLLGKHVRVEHEDHANSHGRVVGANMAGADTVYDHLPLFYSDLFDLGYEAVGEVDSRLAAVENWVEPNREGTIAYVDDAGRPRGYLLWNTWGKVDAARDQIRAAQPIQASTLA
jgi:3-phenylpropionate/trans-cinnamate dioxygenase ferredoxin reductase component